MRSNYVRGASITASASQAEIQDMLSDFGAVGLRCIREDGRATIAFRSGGQQFRMILVLPRSADEELQKRSTGHALKTPQETARQRWRALSVLIRAKLDAVASGIVSFDQEFMAYRLPPHEFEDGRTSPDTQAPAHQPNSSPTEPLHE
ncbi:hypothetical protein [Arthrobacter sp. M4]|uniref:hypothetical protein n=1 Tax=Arthrobacter sp. M4 TaxID=218160 RepID=UPI001CDC7DAE|nr:hypothetical protein [Arthrobacter sp. M4]MCA4133382.1 hypothetical protein [Arthrobacter sp. M4]